LAAAAAASELTVDDELAPPAQYTEQQVNRSLPPWQFGVAVASFVAWTKLLYVEPG